MSARKSERILNLTICLLATRRFLPREQIRRAVEGYHDLGDAAFERTFERDKEDLRAMGVPLQTGTDDRFFDDEPGYRIAAGDFELPPVQLGPAEAAVVALAAQSWQQSRLADSSQRAVAKLRAAGVETDGQRITTMSPSVVAREPAFEVLWQAVLTRTEVGFDYRSPRSGAARRRLQPWGVTSRRGRWYVVGLDLDRRAPRVFKLSRIEGEPAPTGAAEAYEVPEGVDVRALLTSLEPAPAVHPAVLAVHGEAAPGLRRRGRPAEREAPAGLGEGWGCWQLEYGDEVAFAAELAAFGPEVLVLAPVELADRVRAHLTRMLAAPAHQSPAASTPVESVGGAAQSGGRLVGGRLVGGRQVGERQIGERR